MARGYFGVGLVNPKTNINVGAVLRAAQCFDAAFVVAQGTRYGRAPTDVLNTTKHIPFYQKTSVFDGCPFDCEPIAVEFTEAAQCLTTFKHNPRSFYIFGPEDSSLGKTVYEKCSRIIKIPTKFCLNLAAAVNIILYDRIAKEMQA
jgi:tRNA(Leu) C34 or U34 (ribose-2'-O)-methylase TrmL